MIFFYISFAMENEILLYNGCFESIYAKKGVGRNAKKRIYLN